MLGMNGSMLWLDIGLGKTIISLTSIEELLDSYKISSALILAPLKVVEAVWEQEALKWEHTKRLKFSAILGTPEQRLKALMTPADIYLVNYEQLQWLMGRKKATKTLPATRGVLNEYWLDKGRRLPFDMVVYDEISKLKTATSKRAKAFQKILPTFIYRTGLTGTPAANGVVDLHGQYLMVDGGHRLGPNITSFRNRWLMRDAYSEKWVTRRGATEEIKRLVSDITLEMNADDYLQLPPVVDQDIKIQMPERAYKQYKQFEKAFFLAMDEGEVEAFNAGAKSTKCRQLANGAVYVGEDSEEWAKFHDAKIEAVAELLDELGDKPLLLCYQFRHDVERICKRFPEAVCLDRKGTAEKVERWNRGEIKLLIGHPASMGHGLNLQYGGNHVAWFGLPWSLELYDQAIGRIARNGQKGEVVVNHRLIAEGTIELGIATALSSKGKTQEDLRAAVKSYREEQGL
jgi:SNF2 family DNA or RNA helicase